MKNQIKKSVTTLLIVIACLFNLETTASHIAGINMRYDYVGNDPNVAGNYLYKITKSTYRRCNGIALNCGVNQDRIYLECSANGAKLGPIYLQNTAYIPKPRERLNANGARDISTVCALKQTNCQSPTGTFGNEEYFSEAIVSLPRCQVWRVYGTICQAGGNSGYSNFYGTGGIAAEVYINTNWFPSSTVNGAPANSGAHLYNDNRPFINVCVGQKAAFAAGGIDEEGDSLTYEAICPLTVSSSSSGRPVFTPLVPRNGISCSKPIPGFNLDSLSGLMTFTPNTVGSYLVGYYINEYEQCTGILKGRTYREIAFNVGTCQNLSPVAGNKIGNIKGRATLIAYDHMEVCEGGVISWEDTLSDPNFGNTIKIESNIAEVFPGGTMKLLRLSSSKVVAQYSCKAIVGVNGRKFIYTGITDDICDYPGITDHMMQIEVLPSAHANFNEKVCVGDTMLLEGGGGERFIWSSISGDSIKPGINWFSQDTFNRVIKFIPTKTSVFSVYSQSVTICGGRVQNCFTTDTFTIKAAPKFNLRITSDTIICRGDEIQVKAVVSPSTGNYKYSWKPANLFKNDSSRLTTAYGINSNQTIFLEATSDSGCVKMDSIQIKVSNPFPKNMSIEASKSVICLSDTIDLGLNYGSIDYGSCAQSSAPCLGSTAYKTIGKGLVVSSSVPDLYSGKNKSTKTQYLYKAADLKSKGVSAGPISSIAFEIAQLANQGANSFNGFSIKMGCTSDSILTKFFINSLVTVFNPKVIVPVQGMNRYTFDEEYVWDGVENIVVEVCWNNGSTIYSNDHFMSFDAVAYTCANHYYSPHVTSACSSLEGSTAPINMLPKTEFGVCEGINKSNFNFSWSSLPNSAPSGIISAFNKDSLRVAANLTTARQYLLTVSDTAGICNTILSKNISVVSKYNTKPDSLPLQCVKGGIIQLTAPTPHTASNPGGKWTGLGIINDSLGYWDPAVSGAGRFPVTYGVTGDACASSGFTIINIADLPDPSLLGPIKACSMYGNKLGHELAPKVPGGYFSGTGVDSVSGVPTKYYIDGTKFNPTSLVPDTAFVRYKVFKGCWNDTIIKIPVVAPWDSTFTGVLSNGTPIFTKEFCSTASPDTLSVAGINPVWKITGSVQNRAAITDSVLGIFDPKLINNGAGGQVNIQVENKGFCGTKGIYRLNVNMPPEVKILAENFCFIEPGDCIASKIPAADRKKIIKVRVAKYPNRVIDDNDPSTYADVITADKAQTGWPNLIESDKVTKWDGRPWMIFPYKFEYPFCQLPKGRHSIHYQLAVKHRNNFANSDSLCYSTIDTAIHISDKIDVNLTADGDLCAKTSVIMKAGVTGSKYSYKWSDGSKNNSLTTSAAGTYTVTVTSPTCVSEDSITLSYCVSLEELKTPFSASLYPNPARDIIRLEINEMKEQIMLSIFSLNGQLVDEFNFEAINGKLEAEINVSQLPAGVYSFRISNAGEINSYRVVIE